MRLKQSKVDIYGRYTSDTTKYAVTNHAYTLAYQSFAPHVGKEWGFDQILSLFPLPWHGVKLLVLHYIIPMLY